MTIAELFLTTIYKSLKAFKIEKNVKKVVSLDYKQMLKKNMRGMLKRIIRFESFNLIDNQTPIFIDEENKKRLEYYKQCES